MEPYIGITGIRTKEEINAIGSIAAQFSNTHKRTPIGFGFIYSLEDRSGSISKFGLFDLIKVIKDNHTKDYAIIHLNDWHGTKTQKPQLEELASILLESTAIQINHFDWTNKSLSEIKFIFRKNPIILPLNIERIAISQCINLLSENPHQVSAILIDKSEGNGRTCCLKELENLLREFRRNFPFLSVGLAGGLGRKISIKNLNYLSRLMPVSVDAESDLHIEGSLAMERVKPYLEQMFLMIKRFKK